MKTLPIVEVRSLLAAVADHGKQHLAEVEADLSQTSYLLSKAIEKLSASFIAVHTAVINQQLTLVALTQQHQLSADETKQLEMFNQIIGEEVNAAITGLQFQDITSQLIVRAIKRVNGLKDLLQELDIHGDQIDTENEHIEIAKILEEMSQSFHTGRHALSSGLRRSVEQQNMASGEIELF
jgi:molecular chaperone DnaK (HSP70)